MSEIIQLTDTSRLVIEQHDGPENPRLSWDMATGYVNIEGRGDSRYIDVAPVHEAPIPIRDADDRLCHGWRRRTWNDELVVRWARIFHGMVLDYDSEHGGYWFAADTTLTPDQQAALIADEQHTYQQWADNEVYGVILERRATWARITDGGVIVGGEQRTTWEQADSVWDCYLDDSYTAQAVAREHFTLTPDEQKAL